VNKYLIVFLSALIISYLLTPLIKKFSLYFGILDIPGPAKLHRVPVARAGGLAILAGFIFGVFLMVLNKMIPLTHLRAIVFGGTIISVLGLLDDIKGVSFIEKFIVQLSAAVLIVISGIRVGYIPYYLSIPITVIWIVGVTNAINLMDGMDGLASGISFFAGLAFFVLGLIRGDLLLSILSLALAGSCLGFLRHNFSPASIFMGDTGSLFLGFMLSVIGVISTMNIRSPINLFVPVLILGIPVFDTLLIMYRRFLGHQHIFMPDRGHFYDIILDSRKFTYEQVVLLVYVFSILLGVSSLCLI